MSNFKDFSGGNNPNDTGSSGGNAPMGGILPIKMDDEEDINELVINYNEKYKNAGPTLHRDKIIQQTLGVLIGMTKPNPLLIGAAGTGKTKIVEDIAYRIENTDPLIPPTLLGYTVYELPLSNIVAGSSFVGQVEKKIKAVIEFMSDPKNKAILFIDEIHMIIGESSTYEKIAQILKPALARGEMKVIGATTLQEANNLTKDPAFNRRFSRLIVDELSQNQTTDILKQMKSSFFANYGNKVTISDDILDKAVQIADLYKRPGSHRPDNAITLIDRALGDAVIKRHVMELNAQNDASLLQAIQANPLIPLSEKQLKQTALKLMTGNNEKAELDIDELKTKLSVIKGQDDVLNQIIPIIQRHNKGLLIELEERNQPLTMMFAGTSGVGKTEVVKILSNVLTGQNPITLNMTEYHSSASINRIIGSPAGYIGSDSKAELPFDILESNPYQVILLDEFEKADPSVQKLFMRAFDEGTIQTNFGKDIDFSKSIIIATTNAGFQEAKNSVGFGSQDQKKQTVQKQTNMLTKFFEPALINRFTLITTFNMITKDVYKDIMSNLYEKYVGKLKAKSNRIHIADTIDDDVLEEIADKTFVKEFGARPAAKAISDYIAKQVI